MKFQLLTPKREVLAGEVTSVTLPGIGGELQILAGHTEFLSLVKAGELICEGAVSGHFTIGEGHVEVTHDQVTVAVDHAEPTKSAAA